MGAVFDRVPQTSETQAEADRLYKKHGVLREEDIVKASKSPSNPLHPYFMWDDESSAAHMARLEIARKFVMKIVVTVEEREERNITAAVRTYHGTGDGYAHIDKILSDADMRENLLRSAMRDLNAFMRRYNALRELAPVFKAVRKVQRSVEREMEVA